MILYLIRHGKTDAHIARRRQSPDEPLGELGRKQAELVAKKMKLTKIDHLYSSDWPRALQTAEFIALTTGQKIKTHPLVHELEKTPLLNNADDQSEINHRYHEEMRANTGNFNWKFNNEGESLNDAIKRAKKVVKFLVTKHSGETIAIVTHGTFMAILTALILLGPDYDEKSFVRLVMSFSVHNAGISSFKYEPEAKYWKMICFNDHGHLEVEVN